MLDGELYGVRQVWWLLGGLVLLFGVFSLLHALTNRKYVFVDGVIHGVVGRMGSGKSLFTVLRVLLPFCRGLSRRGVVYSKTRRPVRRVVCNFRFNPGLPNVEVRTVQPSPELTIWGCIRALATELGNAEGPWYNADGELV